MPRVRSHGVATLRGVLDPFPPDEPNSMLDSEMMRSEWPPSSYALQVFSSRTGCWEERYFALEGERCKERLFVSEGGHMVQTIDDMKVYWRGALYVPCKIGLILRISMSKAKYRLVPMPSDAEFKHHGCFSLGRSEKGVYCAFQHGWQGLRIFHLNESSDQVGWELKHIVDFTSFACKFYESWHYSEQLKGPWILQDINCYKHPYDNDEYKEIVEDNIEWNSDDDNVLNTEDRVEGFYEGYTGFLGFHPYKEIVLNAALRRAVAYHWNTSKFQVLGNIYPKDYLEVALYCVSIDTSFIYTPCWMEDFPQNNLESRVEG